MQMLLALLAILVAMPVRAEVRGMVHEVVNPEAPREQWSRRPLAGAYVTLAWSVVIPAPAHAVDSCRHAEIARADANGRFVMRGPDFLTARLAKPRILAYSPGREQVAFPHPGTLPDPTDITLARSARATDERLEILLILKDPGREAGRRLSDPQQVLEDYHQALHAKAKALRPSPASR